MKARLKLGAILAAALFAASAWAGNYNDLSGTITTGGVSQVASPSNTGRGRIVVTNPVGETENLCVALSVQANCSSAVSWVLPAGGSVVVDSSERVSVVAATTGHKFTVKEQVGPGFTAPTGGGSSGGGGSADSTAAKQDIGNASLASIVTNTTGLSTSANQSTLNTEIGATNETAAASNAATSGLNGLIRRFLGFFTSTAATDANRLPVDERDGLSLTTTSITAAAPTATVTFTNGSPNIVWTAHGFSVGKPLFLTNAGGALPTNFTAGSATTNNVYVASVVDANTITVAATPGGTAITAGSAGTGTQTGTAISALFTFDMTGYESQSAQITSAGTSNTVTYVTSDDAQNWVALQGYPAVANSGTGNTGSTTAAGMLKWGKWGKYTRAYVSTYTSGTVAGVSTAHKAPFMAQIAVSAASGFTVAGTGAHAASVTGNPTMMGVEAYTAAPTAVTTGQTTRVLGTVDGKVVTQPLAIPEQTWNYAAAAGGETGTGDLTLAAAPAAGLRNYLDSCSIQNASATIASEVVIKDGATILKRFYVGVGSLLNSVVNITITPPLRQPTTATALTAANLTTASQVYWNCNGHTGY